MNSPRVISFLTAVFLIPALLDGAQTPTRERISLNENWRFTKGDPTNSTESLLYDVRKRQSVRRLAEAESDGNTSANQAVTNEVSNPPPAVIKQWILPTGNEFIKDPSRRFSRPTGNPGDGVPYVQSGF